MGLRIFKYIFNLSFLFLKLLVLLPFIFSFPFLSFLLCSASPLSVPSLSLSFSFFISKKKNPHWSLGSLYFGCQYFFLYLCCKYHFSSILKNVIYFAIIVESQVLKSKRTGEVTVYPSPSFPEWWHLHNSSTIPQPGNWHCCNPKSIFRFHQFYLHSLVYLWT